MDNIIRDLHQVWKAVSSVFITRLHCAMNVASPRSTHAVNHQLLLPIAEEKGQYVFPWHYDSWDRGAAASEQFASVCAVAGLQGIHKANRGEPNL
jgi:hypothetical protein